MPYTDPIGGANQFLGAVNFSVGWKFKIQDLTHGRGQRAAPPGSASAPSITLSRFDSLANKSRALLMNLSSAFWFLVSMTTNSCFFVYWLP